MRARPAPGLEGRGEQAAASSQERSRRSAAKPRWPLAMQFVARWWIVAPPLMIYLFFFVAPIVLITSYSFRRFVDDGRGLDLHDKGFTFANYAGVVTPTFLDVLAGSLKNASVGSVLCLLAAYPVAYFISTRTPARMKPLLIALVIVPFWTSYLLRMIGWRVLLGGEGPVSFILQALRLLYPGQGLINTQTAVLIGLVYNYLPMMILPIYASIDRLTRDYREASQDLGSSPVQTFLHVTLPLTSPGIVAGFIIVFIAMLGDYVTPELMGGARGMMIGNLIYSEFLNGQDWPLASAMALSLAFVIVAVVVLIVGIAELTRRLPSRIRRAYR